ncbi:MAG: hypothetical protein ABIN99_13315 [Nitrosospira sp.]
MDQFRLLGIRSPIQRKAVEILHDLQGYSKRIDLLEDQLRKELGRDGVGPSRIHVQLSELIELGLAEQRHASGGQRFALNKDIWDLELPVIELVCTVTEHLANGVRSDTKFLGILKTVKAKIRKADAHPAGLKHSVYEILVSCALRRHPEWELSRGEIVRKGNGSSCQENLKQTDLLGSGNAGHLKSVATDDKEQRELQPKVEKDKPVGPTAISNHASFPCIGIDLPKNILFEPVDMENLLSHFLGQEFGIDFVRFYGSIATIDVPLSLGRGQRIYVSLRRNATHEKIFWIFSVCGTLDSVQHRLSSIIWHNNECHPFKVSFMDFQVETHIGVCTSLNTTSGWERQLSTIVRNLAVFGDHLEENYWRQDDF